MESKNKKKIALSPAKLAANRANALKSTGPRSPEGQRRSAANVRVTRGFRTHEPKLYGAPMAEIAEFEIHVTAQWQPATPESAALVREAAATTWRMDQILMTIDEALNNPDLNPNAQRRTRSLSRHRPSPPGGEYGKLRKQIYTHEPKPSNPIYRIYTYEPKPGSPNHRIYTHEPKPGSPNHRIYTHEPKPGSPGLPRLPARAKTTGVKKFGKKSGCLACLCTPLVICSLRTQGSHRASGARAVIPA